MKIDLKIVLIGNINAGKSSIINALLGKEVVRTSAKGGETIDSVNFQIGTYSFRNANLFLEIIDTPGLSEANGEDRANIAIDEANKGDLILFVVNSDLVHTEKETIVRLNDIGKPIILLFNQIDKYNESQCLEIKSALTTSLKEMIEPDNIILISASPIQKTIIQLENGEEKQVERKGLPDVVRLKERIIIISNQIGKYIGDIEKDVKIIKTLDRQIDRTKEIQEKAYDASFNYAVGMGLLIAVNPIPLLDLLGGATGIGVLVKKIANLYDIPITKKETEKLARELLLSMAAISAGTLALLGIGSLIKMIPFVGWLVGGTTQAASVAFSVLVLGDLISDYFANGQNWGKNNSLKESLEKKINSYDRDKVMRRLKDRIKDKMQGKHIEVVSGRRTGSDQNGTTATWI